MNLLLIVLTNLGGAILAIVGVVHWVRDGKGELNKTGKAVLILGVVLVTASTFWDRYLTDSNAKRFEDEIIALEKSNNSLIIALADQLMKSPHLAWQLEPAGDNVSLQITEPGDEGYVRDQARVCGLAPPSVKNIRVAVHPAGIRGFWVQPEVARSAEGRWCANVVYFGRTGDLDIGTRFEVTAFADLELGFSEGRILDTWPNAAHRSHTITVVRQ